MGINYISGCRKVCDVSHQEGVRCVTPGRCEMCHTRKLNSIKLSAAKSPLILKSSAGKINTTISKFKAHIKIKVIWAVTQCSLAERY